MGAHELNELTRAKFEPVGFREHDTNDVVGDSFDARDEGREDGRGITALDLQIACRATQTREEVTLLSPTCLQTDLCGSGYGIRGGAKQARLARASTAERADRDSVPQQAVEHRLVCPRFIAPPLEFDHGVAVGRLRTSGRTLSAIAAASAMSWGGP